MKLRHIIYSSFFLLSMAFFSSCEKEGIDNLDVVVDDVNPESITCSLELTFEEEPNSGQLVAIVTGGEEPYTYLWSTDETTNSISGTSGETYSLIVTDDEGCTIEGSASFVGGVDCSGFNGLDYELSPSGSITVYAGGGTPPYIFTWSNGDVTTSDHESSITTNEPGISVVVMDANGCSQSLSFNTCVSLELTLVESSPGVLLATAAGGTADYGFDWSTGEWHFEPGVNTSSISVTQNGTYSVTLVDGEGCTVTQTITIGNSDPCASFVMEAGVSNPATGELTVWVNGGTQPYNYEWSTGETTGTINVTESGIYTITVTDGQGCVLTQDVEFNTTTNTDCSGFSMELAEDPVGSGILVATPIGGTAPYAYSWSTDDTTMSITTNGPGVYHVDIVDANGCTVTATIEL